METKRYLSWCADVVNSLRARNNDLFEDVLEVARDDLDTPQPETPHELLLWLRGDEPREEFDANSPVNAYVDFLLEEWRLFGPRGE